MKTTWTLLVVALICMQAWAEVEVAKSPDDVKRFLEDNQDGTAALFFIDTSANDGSESGFWTGVVTSVSHIFSGEEGANNPERVAEIEKEISTDAALLQIDTSNEDFREIQESYDVTTVPFLILFKRGIVVLKEVPTHETHDKILQVLNVNPAAVHADDAVVSVEEDMPVAEPVVVEEPVVLAEPIQVSVEPVEVSNEPVEVFFDEPEISNKPVAVTIDPIENSNGQIDVSVQPVSVEYEPVDISFDVETPNVDLPVIVVEPTAKPAPVTITPVDPEALNNYPDTNTLVIPEPRVAIQLQPEAHLEPVEGVQITLAPGEERVDVVSRPQPVPQPAPKPRQNLDDRRKFIHHKCSQGSTFNDEEAANWRNSPYYISELEDYEVPEDWWRNGYTPLDVTEKRTTDQVVVVPEAEVEVRPVGPFKPYHRQEQHRGGMSAHQIRPRPAMVERPIIVERPIAPPQVMRHHTNGPHVIVGNTTNTHHQQGMRHHASRPQVIGGNFNVVQQHPMRVNNRGPQVISGNSTNVSQTRGITLGGSNSTSVRTSGPTQVSSAGPSIRGPNVRTSGPRTSTGPSIRSSRGPSSRGPSGSYNRGPSGPPSRGPSGPSVRGPSGPSSRGPSTSVNGTSSAPASKSSSTPVPTAGVKTSG